MSSEINLIYREWQEAIRDRYNIKGEQVVVAKPSNPAHLSILKEMCLKAGFTSDQANSILLILEKDKKAPELDKAGKDEVERLGLVWKGQGYGKEGKGKGITHKNVDGKLVKVDDKDDAPQIKKGTNPNFAKPGEEPEVGQSTVDGSHHTSKKPKPKDGEKKELGDMSKEELQNRDKQKINDALMMTKSELKRLEKEKKKKGTVDDGGGVGAGTPMSRAGETMVCRGLDMLINEKKSLDEVREYFEGIVNTKDHVLNNKKGKEWVPSCMATLARIDKEIGFGNITDIVWDTDEGRTSIGVDPKLKTSSDMFVRTEDGRNIGISLKKDAAVFLNNGGWMEQSMALLNDLKEVMPDEQHEALSEAMSYPNFQIDRAQKFKEAYADYTPEQILELVNSLTPEEIKKESLSKYMPFLKNPKEYLEKIKQGRLGLDRGDGPVMKGFHRLLKLRDPKGDQIVRESDNVLTQKTFDVLDSSPEAKIGMNKHIIRSMHVLDTLGLKKEFKVGGVDEFVTTYGIPPDGSVLNEKNLIDLFGDEITDLILEGINEVRAGNKTPEELEDRMAEQIEIDYQSGQIFFKHQNEMKYPLFYLSGRSRGIGTPPVMELGQTPFMGWALKNGSFNTDTWSPDQLKKLRGDLAKQAKESAERYQKAQEKSDAEDSEE